MPDFANTPQSALQIEQALDATSATLQRENERLLELRSQCHLSGLGIEVQFAIDTARNSVACARQDLRRAQTRLAAALFNQGER